MAGIFAGLLVPAIAWFATGDRIYLRLLTVMTCIAAYRIHVLIAHSRTPFTRRRRDAFNWEIRYGIGGVAFMTGVGVTAAILFTYHHTEMVAYYGVILMTGCAGALASRNAGPKDRFWTGHRNLHAARGHGAFQFQRLVLGTDADPHSWNSFRHIHNEILARQS